MHDLLYTIRKKAERENLKDVLKFLSSYSDGYGNEGGEGDNDMNYDGGGIGIVHTTIDLGEGE